jgi:hypothetical protein
VVPLGQKGEKGFFERAAGWVQEKIRGLGEPKELARSILAATLGPLGDELKSWADPEEHPILARIHGRAQRTWEGLRQGAIGAYELTKYMLVSAWEGRWGDAARAWRAWERAPEEIGNAVLDEYEQASMVEQALLGVVAVGDLLDIGVELRKIGQGEKPDLWVLGLAAGGVVLDALAWMNGPLPDPADGANIFVSAIKTLLRNMPDGKSRRLIEDMLADPKQWDTLRAVINTIRTNHETMKALMRDDEALYIVLKNGPEAVELMAKYGDEGVALVAKYGDDGHEILSGLHGLGIRNVREISSGRLRGFLRGNTHLSGGDQAARQLFHDLTGRIPSGDFDRVVLADGTEVVYRSISRTGTPKVEIIDHVRRFLERITFRE